MVTVLCELTKMRLHRGAIMSKPVCCLLIMIIIQTHVLHDVVVHGAPIRRIENPLLYKGPDGHKNQCRYCYRHDVDRNIFQEQCQRNNPERDHLTYDGNVSNRLWCYRGPPPNCSNPGFPNHTRVVFSDPTHAFSMWTHLTLTCEDGYFADSSPNLVIACVENLTWNASLPLNLNCVPIAVNSPTTVNSTISNYENVTDKPNGHDKPNMAVSSKNETLYIWIFSVLGGIAVIMIICFVLACALCRDWCMNLCTNLINKITSSTETLSSSQCVLRGNILDSCVNMETNRETYTAIVGLEKVNIDRSPNPSINPETPSEDDPEVPLLPPSYPGDLKVNVDVSPLDVEGGTFMVNVWSSKDLGYLYVLRPKKFRPDRHFNVRSNNQCQLLNAIAEDSGEYMWVAGVADQGSACGTFQLTIPSIIKDMEQLTRTPPDGGESDSEVETKVRYHMTSPPGAHGNQTKEKERHYDDDDDSSQCEAREDHQTTAKVLYNGADSSNTGYPDGLVHMDDRTMHNNFFTREPAPHNPKADPGDLSIHGGDVYDSNSYISKERRRTRDPYTCPDPQQMCTARLAELETYDHGKVYQVIVETMDPADMVGENKSFRGLARCELDMCQRSINYIWSKLRSDMSFGPTARIITLMVQKDCKMGHLVRYLKKQKMESEMNGILVYHKECPYCEQVRQL